MLILDDEDRVLRVAGPCEGSTSADTGFGIGELDGNDIVGGGSVEEVGDGEVLLRADDGDCLFRPLAEDVDDDTVSELCAERFEADGGI